MQQVVIVYPFLPHYRDAVFHELQLSTKYHYTFASDVITRSGIAGLSTDRIVSYYPLRNLWLARLLYQRGLASLLDSQRFDFYIFVGDVTILSTWLHAIVLRLQGRKVIYWTIGWHRPEKGLKRLVRLGFYRLANHLLIYGTVGRELGIAHGYPPDRMTVIFNSVEASLTSEQNSDPASGLGSDRPIVGAVIRLNKIKRLDLLIRAAAVLASRGTPVTVVLVGTGPAKDDLRRLADQLGVDLRLPGAIYAAAELAEIYRRLSITVVPARVGLTAIQSMSHGIPVISDNNPYTQMPEWEAIVEGKTGTTYKEDNYESLADAIQSWLSIMEYSSGGVAENCHREVADRWTARRQVVLIENAIDALGHESCA